MNIWPLKFVIDLNIETLANFLLKMVKNNVLVGHNTFPNPRRLSRFLGFPLGIFLTVFILNPGANNGIRVT